MSTDPTARLAAALATSYRLERPLGAGGMATVYLAHDIKHDRKVALKVLKPELAAVLGADRFVVEIRTTASLQHPHILPLFDSGTADGFLYYVMPYIEGETIRDKLNRETQFGVDEAIRLAREVAEALDYAHRRGIIHRDIKPENILLHDGRAMVMDFGIALAVSAAAGGRMTETGLSLGTPHYMSPEQATAEKELTPRSDVYSIASVLYEMLAGQPPHVGGAAQQVIMRIITETARPVSDFRKNVPANVVAALAKALEKLPADRFASAKEFADALGNTTFMVASMAAPVARTTAKRAWYASPLPYVAALAASLGVIAWQGTRGADTAAETPSYRFVIKPPADGLATGRKFNTAISADGRRIAFVASDGSVARIHVQEVGGLTAKPIPGTEDARYFAMSPDGRELAVQLGAGGIRRVDIAGGTVTDVALPKDIARFLPSGISWTGTTIAAALGSYGILLIPANGGALQRVQVLRGGQPCRCNQGPLLSPDGSHLLVTGISAFILPVKGGEVKDLGVAAESIVGIVDGLLYFVTSDGKLMAAPLDLDAQTLGTAVTLESGIVAGSQASLSANGTLLMFSGEVRTALELVDERGNGTPIAGVGAATATATAMMFPRFSPDGKRAAVAYSDRAGSALNYRLNVIDIAAGTTTRLTGDTASDRPEWSPDGTRVIYRRLYDDRREELWWQPFDRSGPPEPLQRPQGTQRLIAEGMVSPDGASLIYRTLADATGRDIWYRALRGDTTPKPFEVTTADEVMPRFAPDGRWVTYVSNESGIPEVFVRPFPGPGGRTQISTGGGTEPVWSPDGRRLFYLHGSDLMAANLTSGAAIGVASRERVFAADVTPGVIHANYDVAKDGHHFLMVRNAGGSTDLVVALNWLAEVQKKLAR
jgi:serine/threonine-protein kinase